MWHVSDHKEAWKPVRKQPGLDPKCRAEEAGNQRAKRQDAATWETSRCGHRRGLGESTGWRPCIETTRNNLLHRLCQRALHFAKCTSKSLASILPPTCKVATSTFPRSKAEVQKALETLLRCHSQSGDSNPGLQAPDPRLSSSPRLLPPLPLDPHPG